MKKIISLLLMGAVLTLPAFASAATYNYVDLTGEVQQVEAATPAEALSLAAGSGDTLHSGVALDQGVLDEGDEVGMIYSYIDTSGQILRTVEAATLDAAFFLTMSVRDPNSGVTLVGYQEDLR